MHYRAAQIFFGFLPQTPSLSLNQTVTPYQFLGPYGIVLPHPESFEVSHFISILALKWLTSGSFLGHFQKTQGRFGKNSSPILGKKLKVVESTKDFGQKTQGKLTITGKFLEEAVGYWSLLFLN